MMGRFAPMLAPIMHRINVRTEYFFVPNRLVWDEWEDFITGGPDGTLSPTAPFFTPTSAIGGGLLASGSLADYLGVPQWDATSIGPISQSISMLPFRAYQLIYNEYYRDQNLQDPIEFSTTSGEVDIAETRRCLTMRKCCWEKDYLTSALPFAQRGPAVPLPLQGFASASLKLAVAARSQPNLPPAPADGDMQIQSGHVQDSAGNDVYLETIDNIELDATSTINDLRRSIALQKWLESNARGGARYVEQLRNHFNVISPDARLQRPEFLGGSKTPCVISEVLSTFQSADGEGNPQGNMAGHGISVGSASGFNYRCLEHGYIIGILRVMPRTAYQQGLPRHLTRFDKFDYAFPEFANIGEQEVLNREVNWNGQQSDPTGVFGYQSRYAEYKYAPSTVHGAMKDTLSFWHEGRIFSPGSTIPLNGQFVEADPSSRIFAVDSSEQLYMQIYHRCSAIRPLPYYGTPAGL